MINQLQYWKEKKFNKEEMEKLYKSDKLRLPTKVKIHKIIFKGNRLIHETNRKCRGFRTRAILKLFNNIQKKFTNLNGIIYIIERDHIIDLKVYKLLNKYPFFCVIKPINSNLFCFPDFMFINETTMEMHYASNISGNTAYIGGFYEILKAETTDIIDRIQVTKIEFNIRTDGVPYCRIWGTVTNSSELSYLLAEHCKPIYSN